MSIAPLPLFFAPTTSQSFPFSIFGERKRRVERKSSPSEGKRDWEWLSISAPPSATANGVQKHWSNWKILARGSKSTSLLFLFFPNRSPADGGEKGGKRGGGREGGRKRPFRTH